MRLVSHIGSCSRHATSHHPPALYLQYARGQPLLAATASLLPRHPKHGLSPTYPASLPSFAQIEKLACHHCPHFITASPQFANSFNTNFPPKRNSHYNFQSETMLAKDWYIQSKFSKYVQCTLCQWSRSTWSSYTSANVQSFSPSVSVHSVAHCQFSSWRQSQSGSNMDGKSQTNAD